MSDESGSKLSPFPCSTMLLDCFCMLRHHSSTRNLIRRYQKLKETL
jgi:hypothetical protein